MTRCSGDMSEDPVNIISMINLKDLFYIFPKLNTMTMNRGRFFSEKEIPLGSRTKHAFFQLGKEKLLIIISYFLFGYFCTAAIS